MAEVSIMDQINMILSDPTKATMTMDQIVTETIREFRSSPEYKLMQEAERYYRNRSDVQNKTNAIAQRSNTKIEHPFLWKFVGQKARYLLAKPWSVVCENTAYSDALNEVFDKTFRRKIKSLGKGAVRSGIAWLQPYFSDGKLSFMRIPSTELVPIWNDSEHTDLYAFIHVYDQTVYIGNRKHTITHAEFWWPGGVRWYKTDAYSGGATAGDFRVDKDHGSEETDWAEPHFQIGDKAYNWEIAPIVWLKYNEDEIPLCYFVKDLIDDVNWQTSVTADTLRDIAKFIYVLRGYGGQDLGEFIKELQDALAIKVDNDGGVDKLNADLNIDAVMAFLDKQRRDLYDFASSVDTKDPDLGNASGTAIGFRYMDLQGDCEDLGDELKDTFQRLKVFLDAYFQIIGKGDFTGDGFDVIFNMDMPVNESDVINNVRNSDGIISKKTMLQNHPWVENVDDELAQIEKEKKEAAELYGEGLFDDHLHGGAGDQDDPDATKGGGLNGDSQ